MENRCFIIMPSGEPSGYPQGHFNIVYEYVIEPACRAAGFWPTRSDSTTYDRPLDVVRNIIDSELAICDISANNTDAHYGLAIRHSLDLPVTVVKDLKTLVAFHTNDLGLVEYDESLRIDTVKKAVEHLTEALKNAVTNKKTRHPLLDRLKLGVPQVTVDTYANSGGSPEPIVESKPEVHLPKISPLPDYVSDPFTEDEIGKLKVGQSLFHLNHGKGKVNSIKSTGKDKLASIQFDSGTKMLVLAASDFFRKIKE
jgi:hypothetical protein